MEREDKMSNSATKDMTQGSPVKLIIGFSLPLMVGVLFQQFYNIVDTIIVGRCLGVEALAGVGATGSINFLIIGFCMGICAGCSIPIAQRFGAKDYVDMRRFLANCVWLGLFLATVITVVSSVLCRKILVWMNTPSDIFDYSFTYISIIFLGIPATFLYNILSGVMRSLGNSKAPLVFLLISSFTNIGLDFLCILVFQMGVMGAAVATVSSQLFSGLLCLLYMIKAIPILHIQREEWGLSMVHIKILCGMGLPMGLQYSITAIGAVVLQTALNTLGSIAVAAFATGSKISLFFSCGFDALGTTMATYGGQNVGAKKLDRLSKGLLDCILIGCIYSVVSAVVLNIFSETLIGFFAEDISPELLANAKQFLLINSVFYIALALVNIVRFMIQGMGFSNLAILAGVLEMIARTIVAFFLVPRIGFVGACFASPLAWIMADAFLIPAYIAVKKKLERDILAYS